MSARTYEDGILREQWDDNTRTYTAWNTQGVQTSTRPYTVEENTQADEDARQNAMILDLEGRIAALEAYVFAVSPPDPDGVPWAAGDWPPGAVVTHLGKTWSNNTGVWLNGHYLPGDAAHPFWTELPGEGETVTPWTAGMPLVKGQLVSNGGKTWRYLGNDIAEAPANWAPTVTNATWQEVS